MPLFCWLHIMVPQTSHDVNETVVCIPDITSSPTCNTNEWHLHCTKIDGHYPMSYDVTKLLWINSYSNSEWPTSAYWHTTITCHELMSTSHTQDMVFTTMIMLVCLYLFSWILFAFLLVLFPNISSCTGPCSYRDGMNNFERFTIGTHRLPLFSYRVCCSRTLSGEAILYFQSNKP